MMDEADTAASPFRGPAYMFRCPVCQGLGKTGTTMGFGGSACALCQGRCYLQKEPTPCPCCDAKGGFWTLFGLKWNTCRLCHGMKYLMERPFPCPKCRATGLVKSLYGMLRTPCDLCDRQRYLKHLHGRCIKCNYTSKIVKFFRKCINCGGIGYSQEPQHLCPRCNSTGSCRGNSCMVCGGHGVIHHEVVSCAKCNGAGEIRRTLHLLLGSSTCPTCNGQGYFQVFTSGSAIPVPQSKPARKRVRSNMVDRGKGRGETEAVAVPRFEDEEEVDGEGFWMASEGLEEDTRRVRPRPTPPGKDGIPSFDVTTSRKAGAGSGYGFSVRPERYPVDLGRSRNRGQEGAAGSLGGVFGRVDGGGNAGTGVFSPGVVGPSTAGKRRRAH